MKEFKYGDKVRLNSMMWKSTDKPGDYGLSLTTIYVVEFNNITPCSNELKLKGSSVIFNADWFELVEDYEVDYILYKGWKVPKRYGDENATEIEKIMFETFKKSADKHADPHAETESIAKPVLEERKKDKIRMELVDRGFPLALLELAKVMTWANENKGYKDHDWKNIPNAENAFKGAAARHRVKFDAQRSFGNEMLDCTDEESGIIHLAHELFNTMALLELALVGKVK